MLIFINFENLTESIEVEDETMEGLMIKVKSLFEFKLELPLSLYDEGVGAIEDVKSLQDGQHIKLNYKDVKYLTIEEIRYIIPTHKKCENVDDEEDENDIVNRILDKDYSKSAQFYIFKAITQLYDIEGELWDSIPPLCSLVNYICINPEKFDDCLLMLDYLFDNIPDVVQLADESGNSKLIDLDVRYDNIIPFYYTLYACARMLKNDKLSKYLEGRGCETNPMLVCDIFLRYDSAEEIKLSLSDIMAPKCGAFLALTGC